LDEICKNILGKKYRRNKKKMSGKISGFLRDYVLIFSIIFVIIGMFVFLMGALWYGLRDKVTSGDLNLGFYTDALNNLKEWNFFLLIIGFILLSAGIWYLYSFMKNKKFLLEEIKTNKRSELLKKHSELKNVGRHLPSKYNKMLKDKEKELNIK